MKTSSLLSSAILNALISDNLLSKSQIIFKKRKYVNFLVKFYLFLNKQYKRQELLPKITLTDYSKILLERINISKIITLKGYPLIILLFKELVSYQHLEILFSKFNDESTWLCLLENQHSFPLLEYFLEFCLTIREFKDKNLGKSLFILLEQKFEEYCLGEYSTYVMQKYISFHFSKSIYKLVKKNILNLIMNGKNGLCIINTVICTLSKNEGESKELRKYSEKIMKRILDLNEELCTNIYWSSIIENVISTYQIKAVEYFLETKSNNILGKKN